MEGGKYRIESQNGPPSVIAKNNRHSGQDFFVIVELKLQKNGSRRDLRPAEGGFHSHAVATVHLPPPPNSDQLRIKLRDGPITVSPFALLQSADNLSIAEANLCRNVSFLVRLSFLKRTDLTHFSTWALETEFHNWDPERYATFVGTTTVLLNQPRTEAVAELCYETGKSQKLTKLHSTVHLEMAWTDELDPCVDQPSLCVEQFLIKRDPRQHQIHLIEAFVWWMPRDIKNILTTPECLLCSGGAKHVHFDSLDALVWHVRQYHMSFDCRSEISPDKRSAAIILEIRTPGHQVPGVVTPPEPKMVKPGDSMRKPDGKSHTGTGVLPRATTPKVKLRSVEKEEARSVARLPDTRGTKRKASSTSPNSAAVAARNSVRQAKSQGADVGSAQRFPEGRASAGYQEAASSVDQATPGLKSAIRSPAAPAEGTRAEPSKNLTLQRHDKSSQSLAPLSERTNGQSTTPSRYTKAQSASSSERMETRSSTRRSPRPLRDQADDHHEDDATPSRNANTTRTKPGLTIKLSNLSGRTSSKKKKPASNTPSDTRERSRSAAATVNRPLSPAHETTSRHKTRPRLPLPPAPRGVTYYSSLLKRPLSPTRSVSPTDSDDPSRLESSSLALNLSHRRAILQNPDLTAAQKRFNVLFDTHMLREGGVPGDCFLDPALRRFVDTWKVVLKSEWDRADGVGAVFRNRLGEFRKLGIIEDDCVWDCLQTVRRCEIDPADIDTAAKNAMIEELDKQQERSSCPICHKDVDDWRSGMMCQGPDSVAGGIGGSSIKPCRAGGDGTFHRVCIANGRDLSREKRRTWRCDVCLGAGVAGALHTHMVDAADADGIPAGHS